MRNRYQRAFALGLLVLAWQARADDPVCADFLVAPTAPGVTVVVNEDEPRLIDVLPLCFDSDGDAIVLRPTVFAADAGRAAAVAEGNQVRVTPAPNFNGVTSFTFRVEDVPDGNRSNRATVQVTVLPVNDAPVVANPITDVSLSEDTAELQIPLTSVFADPDGDELSLAVFDNSNTSLVTGAAIDDATGVLTLTFAPNVDGTSVIEISATDDLGAQVIDGFVVTVSGTNDVPSAADDAVTIAEDAASGIVIDVLANDAAGDTPVTVTAGVAITLDTDDEIAQAHQFASNSSSYTSTDGLGDPVSKHRGFIDINPDGTIVYTPNANFHGTDSFGYTITDSDGEQSSATVTVTVTPVNDPPEIPVSTSLTVRMTENTVLVLPAPGVMVRVFDPDTPTASLTAVLVDPPDEFADFELSTDGRLRYQPRADFVGTDTLRFQVSDGVAVSTTYTFTIEVQDDNATDFGVSNGEVEFDFQLATVPLEITVGVEPNVLIVMDDSGSMDWTLATNEDQGRLNAVGIGGALRPYAYLYALPTNSYAANNGNGRVIPSQQAVDALAGAGGIFQNNNYGVWRAFNADYNPIYYNPRVRYTPWIGVDPAGNDFPAACPGRASLDPFQFPQTTTCTGTPTAGQEVDLTGNIPAYTTGVPRTTTFGVSNVNVAVRPWAHYYRVTTPGFVPGTPPAHDATRELVEIVATDDSYDGGAGRTDCVAATGAPNVCTYAEEIQNFANWFTYYRSREYSTKFALGAVVARSEGLRIGYAVINNVAADALPIRTMNNNPATDNKRALLDQIYEVDSLNGTPLRSALDRAGRHYECVAGDSFGSTAATEPGEDGCPILAAPAGQCQQNFTLLFTDGAWNGDADFAATNHDADAADGSVDSAFDGGSYADTFGGTLADVAMNYYERDLQPLADEVRTTQRDVNGVGTNASTVFPLGRMHQHMSTYTIGFGLLGQLSVTDIATIENNTQTAFAGWVDPFLSNIAKVDDLFHAAHNGRGDALSASDPTTLITSIAAAFDEFSQSIGAASAVSFDAARLNLGTTRFRGLYNVRDNSGELLAERLNSSNLYEVVWRASEQLDSISPASRVVVTFDPVERAGVDFTQAALEDVPGVLPAFSNDTTGDDLVAYFRGDRINERRGLNYRERPATRGLLGDIVHSTPLFIGPPTFIGRDRDAYPTDADDLYSVYKSARANRAGVVYVAANDGMLHGFNANSGAEIFAYVPNKIINSDPYSNSLSDLASTAYSHRYFNDLSPEANDVFIKPRGSSTRQWRSVLVGGLGGGGKGYYAVDITDPGNLDDTSNAVNQILWEFTDDDDTTAVAADGSALLNEDGDPLVDDNGLPVKDLGYAYTEPQIQMTNAEHAPGEKKWAAIFGNGYNSTAGYATMFVVFVEAGVDGWDNGDVVKLRTGVGPPACPDTNNDGVRDPCTDADVDGRVGFPNALGSVRTVDEDGNGTVDLAYGGDQLGNLYRFDMRSTDPDDWTVVRVFQAKFDNNTPSVLTDDEVQPITTRPIVLRNPQQSEGFIVVFGTGSYVTTPDGTSEEIQSIYGVWDRGEANGFAPLISNGRRYLVEQQYTNVVDATVPASPQFFRTLSTNCVEYGVGSAADTVSCPANQALGQAPFHRGWYIDLNPVRASGDTAGRSTGPQFPGERAVRNVQIFGGFGFVNSVIPRSANTCDEAPGGYALIFNPATGGTGSLRGANELAFDRNNDGRFDALDRLNGDAVSGSRFGGVPGDSTFIRSGSGAVRVTQESTGDVDERRVPNPGGNRTGRLSWQELE